MQTHDRAAAGASRRSLAALTGRDHVILLGRAATGIFAVLRAWNLTDAWIALPANSCYIVLWAILNSGNHPLLVDIDPSTGNLNPDLLGSLPQRPAVVVAHHLYGIPAPMSRMMAWAGREGVRVIEDCAQAIGTDVDGRPTGGWGDVAVYSFGPGKIVDHGGGGALVTDDAALAASVQRIVADQPVYDHRIAMLQRQWDAIYWALHQYEDKNAGLRQLYPVLFALYSSLTSYQLPAQHWRGFPGKVNRLADQLERRRRNADVLSARLGSLPVSTLSTAGAALWRYPLLVNAARRDPLLDELWQAGFIDLTRWYPSLRWMLAALRPDHLIQPTPNADQLAASIINLPIDPAVSEPALHSLSDRIEAWLNQTHGLDHGA